MSSARFAAHKFASFPKTQTRSKSEFQPKTFRPEICLKNRSVSPLETSSHGLRARRLRTVPLVTSCAETESQFDWIKPKEKNINSVLLTGLVLDDPVIKFFDNGDSECPLRIQIDTNNYNETHNVIVLNIYDDLAEKVTNSVKKGMELFISAKIRPDLSLGGFTLDVNDIKLINRDLPTTSNITHNDYRNSTYRSNNSSSYENTDINNSATISTEELWHMLMADPSKWYDNRKTKLSQRHPDFVHKSKKRGYALWTNSKIPPWVDFNALDNYFENITSTFTINSDASNGSKQIFSSIDDLWEDLFGHPNDWYDNRLTKRSPKQPDFVHKNKDLNIALWIESRNLPEWAKERLQELDETFDDVGEQVSSIN